MGDFADALLAGEVDRLPSLLAPSAEFHSPVADYSGVESIGVLMRAVAAVVEQPRATAELGSGEDSAVFFTAVAEGRPVDGVLRVVSGADGLARDITLMVRPLEALIPAVKRMAQLLG